MPENPHHRLLDDLLAVETGAGRLEGVFLADAELGRMWRAQMALTEACKSVALEDIHLFEGDLVMRPFETRNNDYETARGSGRALALLRVIVAPGDLFADPAGTVERCLRAGFSDDVAPGEAGDALPDPAELARDLMMAAQGAPGPVISAIRAAACLRMQTASLRPASERLLFLCVDHACRKQRAGNPAATGEDADALLAHLRAEWVVLPSVAMVAHGFRAWSPISPRGIRDLLAGLRIETGRAIGQVPVLRRWRDQARRFAAGERRKSHIDELFTLSMHRPILTCRAIAEELGVTDRTARNLIATATEAGLFAPITGRRSYRAWAPLPMAERLRMRAAVGRPAQEISGTPPDPPGLTAGRYVAGEGPDGGAGDEADALAELDAAIAAADEVLGRYRTPKR